MIEWQPSLLRPGVADGARIFRARHVQTGDLHACIYFVEANFILGRRRAHGDGGFDAWISERTIFCDTGLKSLSRAGQRGECAERMSRDADAIQIEPMSPR